MENIAGLPLKKRSLGILVVTLFVFSVFIPVAVISHVAEATDFTSLRSWVTVEIPYFGANSILVKMTAVAIGNHVGDGMWIENITYGTPGPSGNASTGTGSIGISTGVVVVVGRAVIEAKYSADSNTTDFIYIVSSREYDISESGCFPNDYWRIGITFGVNFTAQFDPRTKYCSIPSPYYYGIYNTTAVDEGQGFYSLELEILHPSEFANFVYWIFLPPIILLGLLFLVIILVSVFFAVKKKDTQQLENTLVAIGSAVIVFIPIFQLSTQELKIPFKVTWIDYSFLSLLILYIILLIGVLVGKVRKTSGVEKPSQNQKARKTVGTSEESVVMPDKPKVDNDRNAKSMIFHRSTDHSTY